MIEARERPKVVPNLWTTSVTATQAHTLRFRDNRRISGNERAGVSDGVYV